MANKRKDNKGRVLRTGESQRPNGTYEYQWKDSNKKKHSKYAKTLDELRRKEAEIQKDITDGIDFSAGEETVSSLVSRYMELKTAKLKTNTLRAYSSAVNVIEDGIGSRRIKTIRKSDAQAWFVQLHNKGLARNTISVIKTVIQPAFEMAVDDDAIRKNPFRFNLSELLPDDAVYRDALSEKQLSHYISFVRQNSKGNYLNDIIILAETGMRISELYGLTYGDIDLIRRRVHVRRQLCRTGDRPYFVTSPKSATGIRTIPLTDKAFAAFKSVITNRPRVQIEMMIDGVSGFLFLDKNGRPKVAMHIQNYMRGIQEKYRAKYGQGMPTVSPHVLRHTFCTRMVQSGLDIKSVQYVMGHSKPDISLSVYTHADYDFIEQAFKTALAT